MANLSFITLNDIKSSLGITSSTDDAIILKMIQAAATQIEHYTGMQFSIEYGTKYFPGSNRVWVDRYGLLTVSTIKTDENMDGTFENTYTTSDYVLFPLNDYPKNYIEITEYGDYGTFGAGKKGVEITGTWGYAESSSPVSLVGKTASAIAASASNITALASTDLAIGQTWLIDNEQYYVTGLTASIAIVLPAQNGTSATTHTASSDIYAYEYPADIWQACMNLVAAEYENRGKKGITSEAIGDYRYTLDKGAVNSILSDSIPNYYRRVKV